MKKICLIITMACCILAVGCNDKSNSKTEITESDLENNTDSDIYDESTGEPTGELQKLTVESLPLDDIPVHSIEHMDEMHTQVPEQKIITETKGEIIACTSYHDLIYYLVLYDSYYNDYCGQLGLLKQDTGTKNIEELFYTSDTQKTTYIYGSLEADNETISWLGISLEGDYIRFICKGGKLTTETVAQNQTEDRSLDEALGAYEIDEKYKENICRLVGKNDDYIVWEQSEEGTYKNSCLNIYSISDGNVKSILKEEYGSMNTPVMYNNYICFQTLNDIKSYTADKDFYSNVYIIDLENDRVEKITDNYGTEESLDTMIYSQPVACDEGIVFTCKEKKGEDFNYVCTYYVH